MSVYRINSITMFNSWSISLLILCLESSTLANPASSALAQPQTNPGCLQGWSYMAKSNKCLKVFGTAAPADPPLTWAKAEEYCNRFNGGHLAALKSEEEITFAIELAHATGYDDGNDGRIFIGLVYTSAAGWAHPDGTEFTYVRWWPSPNIEVSVNGKYPSGMLLTRVYNVGYIWINNSAEGNNFVAPFVCQSAPSSEGRK